MTTTDLDKAFLDSAASVLETMFFSTAERASLPPGGFEDAVSCLVQCSGAAEGDLSIAVDRHALNQLCSAFYGEDTPSKHRREELACELTNMIAGSTLSRLLPERCCVLTPPQLCSFERHTALARVTVLGAAGTQLTLQVEGGFLSVACWLRRP